MNVVVLLDGQRHFGTRRFVNAKGQMITSFRYIPKKGDDLFIKIKLDSETISIKAPYSPRWVVTARNECA